MATDTRIGVTIEAQTEGAEKITKLERDIAALGESTGRASPEFAALANDVRALGESTGQAQPHFDAFANEIEALAEQQAAIDNFRALKKETTDLGSQLDRATAKVDALAQELDQSGQVSKASAAAQAQVTKELEAARAAQAAYKDAIRASSEQLDAMRAAAKQAVPPELTASIGEAQQKLAALKAEAKEADSSVKRLATAHDELTQEIEQAGQASEASADAQAQVTKELEAARATQAAYKDAIRASSEQLDTMRAAAKQAVPSELTASIGEAQQKLAALKAEAKNAGDNVKLLTASQKEAQTVSRNAAKAEGQLTAEYQKTVQAAGKISGAFAVKNRALNESRTAAEKLGISTTQLQQAQEQVSAGVQRSQEKLKHLAGRYNAVGSAAQEMGQKTQAGAQQAAQGAGLVQQSTHKVRDGVQSISTQLDAARQQLLGFLGIQLGAGAVKDVIGLADAYKNLQSRIGLVAGEGEHLSQTMDDVQAVALRTHSALESTGVLFTRLAQAGKDAGLGLEQATAQSLALTESINQAVAISGAGAAASDAAITQLIQGLQSGVLRGEEFNSVMEQAPRLARALADGLGVTTGELRKMAESGALTTDVVIQSLQSQGQALEAEFGKLPLTVGRAITDVQTAFMRYVADTDAANGVTEKIAASISFVGENLESLADTLTIAGKGWLAFKAYNMAQTWLDKAKAIAVAKLAVQEEVAATTASTAATAANTGAKVANAAATKTQVAASGVQAAAIAVETAATVANTAAKGAAASASGLFGRGISLAAGAVRGLVGLLGGPVGAAVTVAMFSGEIKKGITSVVEWGLGFTEAGRRMKAVNAELAAQANQEKINAELRRQQAQEDAARAAKAQQAIAAQFDLSKAAQAATAEFTKLTKEGKTAAQAVADIAKGFDTTTQQGLRDFGTTLNKLAADGKLSADQLKAAWGQILKTEDLQLFQLQAQQVFAGTAQGAQIMAQITEATVSQALQRTGLSFGALTGGMGEAARSAINDVQTIAGSLDLLAQQGVDTGTALTASIGKAIDTADSQKAIEAVRGQIEQLRRQLGDKITDGLLQQTEQKAKDLKKALDDATPGIQSVEEAMRKLGVTSSAALKESAEHSRAAYDVIRESGTASARDVREAFRIAAQAAIDAADGVAPAWVRAEAAQRGYAVEVDQSGKAVLKLAESLRTVGGVNSNVTGNMGADWQRLGNVVQRVQQQIQQTPPAPKPPPQIGTDGNEIVDKVSAAKGGGNFSALAYQQQAKDVAELDAWWDEWSRDYADKNWKYTGVRMGRYWFEVQKAQYQNARRDIEMRERIQQNAQARRTAAGQAPATPTPTASQGSTAPHAGATYVSNITLPGGKTAQVRFADSASQSAAEQLLRELAQAKGAAS